MCPACISTTVLAVGGFVSTGGVAALLARLRFKKNKKHFPAVKSKEAV